MKNLKDWTNIVIGLCLLGIIPIVVFINNPNNKAGICCLMLSVIVFVISLKTKKGANKELLQFEQESNQILQDIAINGQNSQFFGIYDINSLNKFKTTLIKRNNKQLVGCLIMGAVLVVCGIFCML